MYRVVVVLLGLVVLGGCRKPIETPAPKPQVEPVAATEKLREFAPPKRLVLFIGDGMGVGQITAGMYAKGERLEMLKLPEVGLMTTHEYEFLTTDSAASASAIATGHKASYESVSVTPGTTPETESQASTHLQTLLELAHAEGLRTGMVATSRMSHATPAAFGAHRAYRREYEGLASDLAASNLDVLVGAGYNNFVERDDKRDLFAEMTASGWATAKTVKELDAVPADALRIAALLTPKDYPFIVDREERPLALAQMVERAIALLDRGNPKGWVLMVEGSFVDWCAHNLDGACATMEVLDLDDAVKVARDYAAARQAKDTLIVVTADHETGGMSVIDPYYSERFSKVLGGEEAAAQRVALPAVNGKAVDAPPPFQHIGVGKSSAELRATPMKSKRTMLGMDELVDARVSIVMGHFSVASRPFWTSEGRFYAAHTPTMVSIHAEGPGARTVAAVRDNADLGRKLRELVAAGAKGQAQTEPLPPTAHPRNVILLLADGMGVAPMTAAHYWAGGLNMVDLGVAGLVSTHAKDYLVNDSGASATAIATGLRTRKNVVGQKVENGKLVPALTALEKAEQAGLATGIVTTTAVTHATPAAFYAHRDDRGDTPGIVADLISLPTRAGAPEVVLGGGASGFDDTARQDLEAAGYTVATSWPIDAEANHVVGMFAEESLARAAVRLNDDDPSTPTLAEMTSEALRRLEKNDAGFFLLVEGGQIDWRLHEGATDTSVLSEVVDFDEALAAAQKWAEGRDDTLIIVTSDHDHTLSLLDNHYAFESGRCGVAAQCGGPMKLQPITVDARRVPHTQGFAESALQGDYGAPVMYLQYAWPVQEAMKGVDIHAPHAANFVPLFAAGPGSEDLRGFRDQPEIGQFLHRWLDALP